MRNDFSHKSLSTVTGSMDARGPKKGSSKKINIGQQRERPRMSDTTSPKLVVAPRSAAGGAREAVGTDVIGSRDMV